MPALRGARARGPPDAVLSVGRGEGEAVRIPINLTRQDVADMVGSTVETSIRILSRLAKDGVIETKGKTIYIRDMERLAAIPDEIV